MTKGKNSCVSVGFFDVQEVIGAFQKSESCVMMKSNCVKHSK